jgi:hypothetical protein
MTIAATSGNWKSRSLHDVDSVEARGASRPTSRLHSPSCTGGAAALDTAAHFTMSSPRSAADKQRKIARQWPGARPRHNRTPFVSATSDGIFIAGAVGGSGRCPGEGSERRRQIRWKDASWSSTCCRFAAVGADRAVSLG